MRNVTYAAGALAALLAFAGSAVADSRCSNVSIQVKNDYRDPATNAKVDIKVVDLKYWDKEDDKWRGLRQRERPRVSHRKIRTVSRLPC